MSDVEQTEPDAPVDVPADAAPERTFTQEQVDRLIRDRLARQKAQFSDYDEIKARASKLDEIEEANKTELQKATDRLAALERQAAEAQQLARENSLRAAVVSEAAKRNVVDPDAVLALLDRKTLEFDDAGTPTNLGDAITSLLEAKTYLVAGTRPSGAADLGARNPATPGQLSREELKSMSPEDVMKAIQDGRANDLLKGGS